MATAVKPKDHPPDLDALERDAQERVTELRQQRQRIAPEALTDASAKQELLDVEVELAEAERAAGLVPLARAEGDRREAEAKERAESEHRDELKAELAKLDGECAPLAEACDRAIHAMVESMRALLAVWEERRQTRTELEIADGHKIVGEYGELRPAIAFAIMYFAGKAGIPRGLIEFAELPPGDFHPLVHGERPPETETK